MKIDPRSQSELQIKSTERVRDLGEVFTPAATVQKMLDLLPKAMWAVHPSPTFLEPACGDGNFLVAILERKLRAISTAKRLPAGPGSDAQVFHALEALASIYAVDISIDNVVGGTPGHELGARTRLLEVFTNWHRNLLEGEATADDPALQAARWIVERNVQVGNMLPFNPDGTASHRNDLPLIEYLWDPAAGSVELLTTTLGAVSEARAAERGEALTLFGAPEPTKVWEGKALQITEAPIDAPALLAPARNGRGL